METGCILLRIGTGGGSSEHRNYDNSGSIKGREFLDCLSDY